MSHNAYPREQGREETPTCQVPSCQPGEAPAAMGITSHPSGVGTATPILAACRQRVITLGGSSGRDLLSPVQREQPPPAESPTEWLGLACKADLPHRAPLLLTTSLQGPPLYPQPPPQLLWGVLTGGAADPLGAEREGLCLYLVSHGSPRLLHTAVVKHCPTQQKSSLIKRASFGNRQIYCTTQRALQLFRVQCLCKPALERDLNAKKSPAAS